MRVLFYFLMTAAATDEETQKRGTVFILLNMGPRAVAFDFISASKIPPMLGWLPVKLGGLHICYDNPNISLLLSAFLLAVGSFARVRCRGHLGR